MEHVTRSVLGAQMIWESNAVTFSLKAYTECIKGATQTIQRQQLDVKDLVTTGLACTSGAAEGVFSLQLMS